MLEEQNLISSSGAPVVDEDDLVIQQMERRLGIKGKDKRGADRAVLGEDLDFLLRYKEDAQPELASAGLAALDELEGEGSNYDSEMEQELDDFDEDVMSDNFMEEELDDEDSDDDGTMTEDADFAALNKSLSLPTDFEIEPEALVDPVCSTIGT